MTDCHVCERLALRDAGQAPLWDNIFRGEYWDLVHAYNSTLLGWLVLVARRHVRSSHELSKDESFELGSYIAVISRGLQHHTGCTKVYQMQYSEQPGHEHLHMHFVPREEKIPENRKGVFAFGYLGADDESRVAEDRMNGFAKSFGEWMQRHV